MSPLRGLSYEDLVLAQRGALVDHPSWPWTDDLINDRVFAGGVHSFNPGAGSLASVALHNPAGSNKTLIIRWFSALSQNVSSPPIYLLSKSRSPLTAWTLVATGRSLRTDSVRRSGEIHTQVTGSNPPSGFEELFHLVANSPPPIFPVVGAVGPGGSLALSFIDASAIMNATFAWKELGISLPEVA